MTMIKCSLCLSLLPRPSLEFLCYCAGQCLAQLFCAIKPSPTVDIENSSNPSLRDCTCPQNFMDRYLIFNRQADIIDLLIK